MKENVLFLLEQLFDDRLENFVSSQIVADYLKISRNRASSYLNSLVVQDRVVKVNSRPVGFYHKQKLEFLFKTKLSKNEFSSLFELQSDMNEYLLDPFSEVIGYDSSLENIIFQCKAAASYSTDGLPTMLVGKSGTGKSYLAEKIYEFTKIEKIIPDTSSFVHVNCSDYSDNPDFFLANLFGTVKGSYTGAYKDTTGLIEKAQNGYLFLDEIHALNSNCQEKLFQLMDTSKYHKLGDNEKWYQSSARFLFATTEYPSTKLLPTLLRRIPVILSVPPLIERGNKEKLSLVAYLLEKEQINIGKTIKVSDSFLNYILEREFSGNVGELSNLLKISVAKENYLSKRNTLFLRLDLLEYEDSSMCNPMPISEDGFKNIEELKIYYNKNHYLLNLIKEIEQDQIFHNVDNISELKSFFSSIWKGFQKYKDDSIRNIKFNVSFKKKLEEITNLVKRTFNNSNTYFSFTPYDQNFEQISLILTILYTNDNYPKLEIDAINKLNNYLELTELLMNKEYVFSNILLDNFYHSSFLCSCLTQMAIISFIEVAAISTTQNSQIGLILAHGNSLATEVATTVNHMLNSYIFESINLPLTVNTKEINIILQDWVRIKKNSDTIIIFTDMGSLNNLKELKFDVSTNLIFINSINPPLVLSLGNDLLQKVPINTIEKNAQVINNQFEVSTFINKNKKNCIICSSGSGKEADNKIKSLLEKSLPRRNNIYITTLDFESLSKVGFSDDFLENNDVKFIIGTLDPNISNIPFISIGDLIADSTVSFLNYVLSDLFDEKELQELSKNLLNEFALTNLVNQLTILDPKKLLSLVTTAIDNIQKQVKFPIPINTSFGLYIHTCCMIERLIRTSHLEEEKVNEAFENLTPSFIKIFRNSFDHIENYYSVKIPIEEIHYIKNYIYND